MEGEGQVGLEFLVILSGLLVLLASLTLPLYREARGGAQEASCLAEARETAGKIAAAVNAVYGGGPGARLQIEVWLPKEVVGVYVGGYDNLEVDGILASDGEIQRNGRADVRILLDFDGDGKWDNRLNSTVVVDTLLPSRWWENGEERGEGWVRENGVHVEDQNFVLQPGTRTKHQLTFAFVYDPFHTYPRRITLSDEVVG
ncbi:MAG: hypothetical protein QXM46_01360 [Candidatus Hadarchaeales archaeon]